MNDMFKLDTESEEKLKEFSRLVTKHFFFLKEIGFRREKIKRIDFEYPRDRTVEILFFSNKLCVSIIWAIAWTQIGVGLIELNKGEMPDKYSYFGNDGIGRAIDVADLAEYITNGAVQNPLPQSLKGDRHNTKKWIKRGKLIEEKMDEIIKTYADMLDKYGRDVLNGDFSIFPEVQKYAKSKLPWYWQ